MLLYSGTGNADGTDGDTILLGPPFVVTDDELDAIAESLADAVTRGRSVATADGSRRRPPAVPDRPTRRAPRGSA